MQGASSLFTHMRARAHTHTHMCMRGRGRRRGAPLGGAPSLRARRITHPARIAVYAHTHTHSARASYGRASYDV